MNASRKLGVGFYVPSQNFKDIPEMTAVFFEDTMQLVAVTGPANDAESEEYANLFAKVPELIQDHADIIAALREAEIVLSEKWNAENWNFKPHDMQTARDHPHIFAKIKDEYEMDRYPTAAALVKVRAVIQKHDKK